MNNKNQFTLQYDDQLSDAISKIGFALSSFGLEIVEIKSDDGFIVYEIRKERNKVDRIADIVAAYKSVKNRYKFDLLDEQLMSDIQRALQTFLPFAKVKCDLENNPPLDELGKVASCINADVSWQDFPITPTFRGMKLIFGDDIDIEYSDNNSICFKRCIEA